ncbi:hypothetical protein BJV77DRAFT_1083398 [Russula vinacea]|nr:hypothetical protein BJV77DRAFT_1083398 [Russula vinacea]
MPPSPPTEYEIRKISRRTVNIITDHFGAKNVCLLGSAAAALWADIKRVPNDIDILITPMSLKVRP